MKRGTVALIFLMLLLGMLFGCNTIHGIGKDIESGGKAIERSSGK